LAATGLALHYFRTSVTRFCTCVSGGATSDAPSSNIRNLWPSGDTS
jgi:hypothetical protein